MSGEGLTADNRSIILDAVLIMVHVGVAALVKELLVAAVMGMAAPRGGERRTGPHSQARPLSYQQRPCSSVPFPHWSDLQTEAQRGVVTFLRSHSQVKQASAPGSCP